MEGKERQKYCVPESFELCDSLSYFTEYRYQDDLHKFPKMDPAQEGIQNRCQEAVIGILLPSMVFNMVGAVMDYF
jgi:hypothetical protein